MSSWKSDGEYWTRKGRIHHKDGGNWIESVKKDTNYVSKSKPDNHGETTELGAM